MSGCFLKHGVYRKFHYHMEPFHLRDAPTRVQGWSAPALQQTGKKPSKAGTKMTATERLYSVTKS